MCFLVSLCVLARLSALCHVATCFFVVVVHFSLITTLSFVLFHLIHYWQLSCGCIECLCVCFLASLCILARLSASCHVLTCFFVDFSLMISLFVLFHLVHYWRHLTILCDCIECLYVCLFTSSHCALLCEALCVMCCLLLLFFLTHGTHKS